MLDKRPYSRDELLEIYSTSRIDAIKQRLNREGYTYTTSGRGKNLVINIEQLPTNFNQFRLYCIETLGFSAQTDFKLLFWFIYYFLVDDNFINLTQKEMIEYLKDKEGINIGVSAISHYIDTLNNNGLAQSHGMSYVYYIFDNNTRTNIYLTRENYNELYKSFFQIKRQENEFIAFQKIFAYYGSIAKKKPKREKNGFYLEQYETLLNYIEKELKNNGKEKEKIQ